MRWRSPFVVFPLVALALGVMLSSQRQPEEEVVQLAPYGLPPRVDYTALAVDAGNPRHLYAGSDNGVFATRDAGRTWALSGLPGVRVDTLVQARGVLYATSGERVWRFDTTWKRARARPPTPTEGPRRLDPGPVLRLSVDGGKTWRTVLEASGGVPAAAWSPSEPGVGYAVGGDAQLYRSDDNGETWLIAG